MSDLVERLTNGEHPVEISLRPEKTLTAFRECLDRGYVYVKFINTRGGTELGVRLESDKTTACGEDLQAGSGRVRLVGTLTLDYVPVRCVAEIDLASLAGTGHLEKREM